MRRFLAHTILMTSTAAVLVVTGVLISICLSDFSWLTRFGALVTFIGIVVLNRPVIIRRDILPHVKMTTGLSSLDPGHYRLVNEPVPDAVVEDRRSRNAVRVGILITLMGTVIWGFGDLLNCLFGFSRR
jgi:hypothetical protein